MTRAATQPIKVTKLSFFIYAPPSVFSCPDFTIKGRVCQWGFHKIFTDRIFLFLPRLRRTRLQILNHEVMKMSPKELLYIEDALGHTQFLMNQCRNAANQLTDPVLRQQAQQLVNSNQKLFTQFYDLV